MYQLRDNLRSSGESRQMMPRIAVVALYGHSVHLANNMSFGRQNCRKRIPCACIKDAPLKVFHLVIEPLKGCSITIAEHPCHGSPCTTINGFDDPKFVFFDPTKCHISSNSIS